MFYKYLTLGLLSERPTSGCDVKKQVRMALNPFTTASSGTLYPMLHRLLAEGSVNVEDVPQTGRPSRNIYSITEMGRGDLLE